MSQDSNEKLQLASTVFKFIRINSLRLSKFGRGIYILFSSLLLHYINYEIGSEGVKCKRVLSKISQTLMTNQVFITCNINSLEKNTENQIQTLVPHLCPMGS
jgi:hypothetical protein